MTKLPGKLSQTLRFRLTLWNTVVVLLAALAAMFAVREGMRFTLEKEARELLREEATELELAVKEFHSDLELVNAEFARKVLSHSQHDWFAALVNDNYSLAWKSENYPAVFRDTSQLSSGSDQPFAFQKTGEYILVRHIVETTQGRNYLIVLGSPVAYINGDVWSLTKIMLWIGALLLVVAPIGGYLLARRATQPVRQIIATTRSLDPSHLNSRLEIRGAGDELDQISAEINSFLDQISKYLNSHREFIANAAHELRSPLTAIQTSVEVSLGKVRSVDEYREELETVSEQCEQLRHLVNQLLELAETDAAFEKTIADFDLTELIQRSIDVFSGVAEERNVVLQSNLQPAIIFKGDAVRIRQVINNLIDNALKFTPGGGRVRIELVHAADRIVLHVRDSGPGVPEADIDKICERFYQVDPARQRDTNRGNGLGLSICKSIVEMHAGTFSVANIPNSGLQVRVTFPTSTG